MKKRVLILGGGLSGLSCAYFLKKLKLSPEVFEKDSVVGGLCRSTRINGFTFDRSGHLLHFRNPSVQRFINRLLANKLKKHTRNSSVFFKEQMIPYPFQYNFRFLSPQVSQRCLIDFINANTRCEKRGFKGNHFKSWLECSFGEAIAKEFMLPYNSKFWRIPLNKISSKGTKKFIFTPTLKQTVDNYQVKITRPVGYNAYFWYPKQGGIDQLPKALARRLDYISTSSPAVKVDISGKKVFFDNGTSKKFDVLISTVPLPELISMCCPVPKSVSLASKKLRCLSVFNLNLGIAKKMPTSRHWVYFHQKNIPFFRVGFYDNFSSGGKSSSKSSLYAEVSYINNLDLPKGALVGDIKRHLMRIFPVLNSRSFVAQEVCDMKYAYPVYDLYYHQARNAILSYLSGKDVVSCGRFGSWQYMSMEDVVVQACSVAQQVKRLAA